MLLSLFLALAPVQNLQPSADLDEKRKNRITPTVTVVQAARPAVVYIQTGAIRPLRDIWGRIVSQQEVSGAGSGVVIRKEGFIITNYHVIRNAERITVSFDKEFDDQEYNATVVSFVEEEDLALLKIQGSRPFPIIPLGRSGDLMIGETVVAIGNPYGQTITVTEGIIAGLHRNVPVPQGRRILEFPDLIQTDAAINPGNSGGPLVNLNGELIGINNAIDARAQNMGFAIPVDRVRSVLENQLLSPETAPAWLGFEIEAGDHLCVARVVPGSPAAKAGLKPGDCIVAMAGEKVVNQDEYRAARLGLAPWSGTELQIDRRGDKKKIELEPWDRDVGFLYEHLGVQVEARPAVQGTWLYVTSVRPGGPAAETGLEPGDLIDALRPRLRGWRDPAVVETRENLVSLISSLPAGTQVDVEILRDLDKDSRYSPQEERLRGTITPE